MVTASLPHFKPARTDIREGERAEARVTVSNFFPVLLQFSQHDYSWMAQFFSLLILPFAHEDLAMVLGAYVVVNKIMPASLVVLCIYGGMVVSDVALYGVGAGARRMPWLDRLAVGNRVRGVAETINRNLFGLLALCRVVPGVAFIALVACGWTRVPLGRFMIASMVSSALYLPLMLYLLIVFGDAMDDHVGWWAWPLLVAALASMDLLRRRVFSFQTASGRGQYDTPQVAEAANGRYAMPALNGRARRVAMAERIPPMLFNLPLMLSWIRFAWRHRSLTLPTVANPRLPGRGRSGESQSDYLADAAIQARDWIADFVVVTRGREPRTLHADLDRAVQSLRDTGLSFPLVAKPDIGWHGYGVRRIEDMPALREYLSGFPGGARLILQRFVPHAGEAAVLYARLPGAGSGRILSLTFRYHPHVIGDGRSSVRELIRKDARANWKARFYLGRDPSHRALAEHDLDRVPAPGEVIQIALIGSQRAGGLSRDARHYITPALEARIDAIARGMSEFHYGRFDLRFATTEDLMRGENFSIIGISGTAAEAIDAWDPHLPVVEAYRRFVDQQRIVFLIGEKNRARGFEPVGCADVLKSAVRRFALIRRYPASA
jgi:membrane protein DedA with SNARE-associated domain